MNPMLCIDGYKLDHRRQYPPKTQYVFSNWTPRSSRVDGQREVVFFGLQYFLKEYMTRQMGEWFDRPRFSVEAEYKRFVDRYLGPDAMTFEHIGALHELGYVPLLFKAVPEGTRVPLRIPMVTVENTHEDFAWLVNYFETLMSNVLWMPCTSATSAYRLRKMLDGFAEATGDPKMVPWQGHDFSMRGMAGIEAAALSGMGHLLSFTGTDTVPAIQYVEKYYAPPNPDDLAFIGGSVPATEHSVMSAGGDADEEATFRRLLKLYPKGIVSVVSDTWNLWDVLWKVLPRLKDEILARDGKLVIRPDSGDPVKIICGDEDAEDDRAFLGVVEYLWVLFGGKVNEKGCRELDPHIGVIYGDAINYDRAREICRRLTKKGFASTNVVFGVGSYTYQHVTRDTYGFAMKATWAQIDGQPISLYKTPITDDGTKNSLRGKFAVLRDENGRYYVEQSDTDVGTHLKFTWDCGQFMRTTNFDVVRSVLHGE